MRISVISDETRMCPEGAHVICINFVCQRLRDVIPHNLLCRVQEIAGRDIDALFVLEECIKKKIGVATLIRAQETIGT